MENETENKIIEELPEVQPVKKNYGLSVSIFISALIIVGGWIYATGLKNNASQKETATASLSDLALTSEEELLPSEGVILPVRWGDLGLKLASAGVIDRQKFDSIYASRGGISEVDRRLLEETNNGDIRITSENAGFLLNLFWALGLGAKNEILENGPMNDSRYGGAGNFASTGGWTLAQGNAMDHYSQHQFFVLTPEQQQLVEQVSKNIYRPCCDNSTHFPDCNHGMAMLGLLELMASQGAKEETMYKAALQVNAYWFPDTYLTIAQYLASKGVGWKEADPKELLGADYSSGSGYRRIKSQFTAPIQKSGGSCGV